MQNESKEFLHALFPSLPEDERAILCGFPGDPNKSEPFAWKPRPWRPSQRLSWPKVWNAYVAIASFRMAPDGTWRRRSELFGAGRALMVDDVGTKVPADLVQSLTPSAIVETSPGNQQWWYFLSEPEYDSVKFDGVIRGFIHKKLLGADPGMSGVTRVGRLPGFFNGKRKYGGFTTKLTSLNDLTYTTDELLDRLDIKITGRRVPAKRLPTEEALDRNRQFLLVYKWLLERGMLKRNEPDLSGWTEMHCPWIEEHTDNADNGAAIAEPSESNGWTGGFRCHHGHCQHRVWRDLTDWINEMCTEELNRINKEAAQ